MKKHINLFASKKTQESLAPFVVKAKKYGFITLALLVLILGLQIGGYFVLANQKTTLTEKQAVLASFVQSNRVFEDKIARFLFKRNLLIRYIKDDAQFSAYYGLFQDMLEEAKLEAKVESFSIDKNRSSKFVVSFDDYDTAKKFMQLVETPLFLNRFLQLKVLTFTAGTRSSLTSDSIPIYRVELEGIFKQLSS